VLDHPSEDQREDQQGVGITSSTAAMCWWGKRNSLHTFMLLLTQSVSPHWFSLYSPLLVVSYWYVMLYLQKMAQVFH